MCSFLLCYFYAGVVHTQQEKNKAQMKGGRKLLGITARLKPLQTPVMALTPPIAPAIGLAPRVGNLGPRTPLPLTREVGTFPHIHLNPGAGLQRDQRCLLSMCILPHNPKENPPAVPPGHGQAKQESLCMGVARSWVS